ncbi:hypothetical protein BV22DRAFT_809479 [Leucogyrophana mollusca]|uniref:Uncharacterized protein n=1 Tax=Leucogyrophana mollusca TaxID=85980 RepID=A0ACB8B553_9AGAM|nr:hypothetical protein BV22DRAFT_809479 [Leucogyrophana mollusca]
MQADSYPTRCNENRHITSPKIQCFSSATVQQLYLYYFIFISRGPIVAITFCILSMNVASGGALPPVLRVDPIIIRYLFKNKIVPLLSPGDPAIPRIKYRTIGPMAICSRPDIGSLRKDLNINPAEASWVTERTGARDEVKRK